MADYSDIALLKQETEVMAAISGMVGSSLKIDPTADTNIPVDSKRLVDVGSGLWRFQNWNGSAWVAITIDADTLQGSDPNEFYYAAGEGVDIAEQTISLEQASESNLGGVQLAVAGDDTSDDLALSPARAKELIDASVSPVSEIVSGQVLVSDGQYMLPITNGFTYFVLPNSPVDGTVVRIFSRDASQGAVGFLSSGIDEVILDDDDPKVINTIAGVITTTDNFDIVDSTADFNLINWSGYRVINITDGSVGQIESVASSTVLQGSNPTLVGGVNNIFTEGDAYVIDGGAGYIPINMEFGLCELIFRNDGSFKRWTYRLSGNSTKSIFSNPGNAERKYLNESGSLYDVLDALDAALDKRLNVSNPFYRAADYVCHTAFSGTQYDICVSSSEIVGTIKRTAGGGSRHIANFGTANVVLRVGETGTGFGTTSTMLAVGGALVAASAADILIPPGSFAVIHRRADKNGLVGDDKIAYVTGSSGCTKS